MIFLSDIKLCIIGLGYVGLPLAVEFAKKFPTIGFDLNVDRIEELRHGKDATLEVSEEELAAAKFLQFTADAREIGDRNDSISIPAKSWRRPAPSGTFSPFVRVWSEGIASASTPTISRTKPRRSAIIPT